jgi:GNAT superfamily N-acetyltransferase
MTTTLRIVRAEPTPENLLAILGLVDEAADWLRDKGTNQWAKPWPDERGRNERVLKGLQVRKTWIVWDGDRPAATVTTATRAHPAVWRKPYCQCDLSDSAVYAHRLITARGYSGLGLGSQLIDWAGLRARREYGAKWIRIDVWATNAALHDYYQSQGFEPCGRCPDPRYPSGALFQKPVAGIQAISSPRLTRAADFALPRAPAPARDAG